MLLRLTGTYRNCFFITLLLLAACVNNSVAQDSVINVASFRNLKLIDSIVRFDVEKRNSVADKDISKLAFTNFLPSNVHATPPSAWVEQDMFLRLSLTNSADTARPIAFYPGIYFPHLSIFRLDKSGGVIQEPAPDVYLNGKRFRNYKQFTVPPHDTTVYYVKLRFLRTSLNAIVPQLFSPDYVERHQAIRLAFRAQLDMCTYIACGMLVMMIFYSIAVFLQNGSREFIYYALYAFCMGALLFLISFLGSQSTPFNFFYVEYLDLIILSMGVFFYFKFMRTFLSTKENHPLLEKVFFGGQVILVTMLVIFSAIYFFTDRYIILNFLEDLTKQFMIVVGAVFIIYGIRKKNKLMNYLVAGNIGMVIFSILSFLILLTNITVTDNPNLSALNRPLFYYEIGLVVELMLFLAGLAFKNRLDIIERVRERERLKLENERKEFEKQMAVMAAQQEERDRISIDMHDELGSGMTAIRLMSEIVKSKLKDQSFAEIEKISNSANDLLSKMNTIIWTMKSSNDSLESLVAYLRAHAIEYFDSTPIECVVHMPEHIPQVEMSGEKRRNIFLSFKESLNNIMKHSQATLVEIDITTNNDGLEITVADNGVGINTEKLRRFGNGLSNMKRRMENINGDFRVETDGGTVLTFRLPVVT